MPRTATLPFTLRRSRDTYTLSEYTSTTETVHGLLHLAGDRVTIQWRVARKVDHVGTTVYRTDEEVEQVREVTIPLSGLGGALVRDGWLERVRGPRLVLTASDLRAFEGFAGPDGLRLEHPAQLVLRVRRRDRLAAREFAAELELAVAEQLPGGASGGGEPPPLSPGPRLPDTSQYK